LWAMPPVGAIVRMIFRLDMRSLPGVARIRKG
jgi:hypothetical protein